MTDQEINLKIAKYMGLDVRIYDNKLFSCVPDYCNSLDAVWGVEEKLKAEGKQIDYVLLISAPYEALFQTAHATAKEKCNAIIKVLQAEEKENEEIADMIEERKNSKVIPASEAIKRLEEK